MEIQELLKITYEKGASDLHLTVGIPPTLRLNGSLLAVDGQEVLTKDAIQTLAFGILTEDQKQQFQKTSELDYAYAIDGLSRFRVNMFWQRGSVAAVFRIIPSQIPTTEELNLPEALVNLIHQKNGLVLVTGPTGSGKSTTLAAMINKINQDMSKHILTIEDPVEFVYHHEKSIVNQREVGADTHSFANALRAALREDPDVILIGEMRDLETIHATLTIAETGHLAFATLHTVDVSQTVDRIIDVFPPHQQQQIRMLLSVVLRGVVCQQLLPNKEGTGRVAAREILIADHAIANMIRESQTPQIYSRLQTGRSLGMQTMDFSIQDLHAQGLISKETAEAHLISPTELSTEPIA